MMHLKQGCSCPPDHVIPHIYQPSQLTNRGTMSLCVREERISGSLVGWIEQSRFAYAMSTLRKAPHTFVRKLLLDYPGLSERGLRTLV